MSIGCVAIGPRFQSNGLCKVFVETQYPEPEAEEVEVISLSEALQKPSGRPKVQYLPGERLLKKINQQEKLKRKKINSDNSISVRDMDRINRSFQNLMNEF